MPDRSLARCAEIAERSTRYPAKSPDALIRAAIGAHAAVTGIDGRPTVGAIYRLAQRLYGFAASRHETAAVIRAEFPVERREVQLPATTRGWIPCDLPLPAPGVYAIYADGLLSYIGSSARLRDRLAAHPVVRRLRALGKTVVVKVRYTRPLGEHLAAEYRLILRLGPPLNGV
jgi:hypothetical protein